MDAPPGAALDDDSKADDTLLDYRRKTLDAERAAFEEEKTRWERQQKTLLARIHRMQQEETHPIQLNVGGRIFTTSMQTLTSGFEPNSLFVVLFGGKHEVKKDIDSRVFVDRDPHFFDIILNYLRTGRLFPPLEDHDYEQFLLELEFYCFDNALHSLQEGIIVVGGRVRDDDTEVTEQFLDSVEKYCPSTNRWSKLPPINFLKSDGAAAVLSGVGAPELYSLGGQTEKYITSTAEMYSPQAQWLTISDMNSARYVFAATTLNNEIYALGGHGKDGPMGTCEKFSPVSKTWTFVPSMPSKRFALSACTLGNQIYIVGGQDERGTILNTVEKFCPTTDTWKSMPCMNSPRKGHVTAVLEGEIYVMGGEDGRKILNSVEKFSPVTGQWAHIAPMNSRRSFFSAVTLDDVVYVLGGFDGHVSLKSVERYDKARNQWVPMMSMHTRRIGLIAAAWPGHYRSLGSC